MRPPWRDQTGWTASPANRLRLPAALDLDDPELAAGVARHRIEDLLGGVDQPAPVGRPRRIEAGVGDAPHRLAGGAHDEQPAAVALGAEGDALAVGREGRPAVVGRIGGERNRAIAADPQQVEIEVARRRARVDDHPAVRRQRRLEFGARQLGQTPERERTRFAAGGGAWRALRKRAEADQGQRAQGGTAQEPSEAHRPRIRDGHRRSRARRLVRSAGENVFDHDPGVGDVVQAVLRVALEAAAQKLPDRARRAGGQAIEVDLLAHHRRKCVDHALALEQPHAGEHLVEQHAERPDVSSLVDRSPPRLLGSHVSRGAQDHAQLRPVHGGQGGRVHQRRRAREIDRRSGTGSRFHRLGQPEIEDLGFSFTRSFYVLWLEIAVDDALVVSLFQRLCDLLRERKALSKGKSSGFEAFGECRSLDQLHDESACFAAGLEAVDLGDVRMVQLGEELRLALEAGQALLVLGERGGEDLDRHLALELGVGGAVDLPHAAFADLGGDLVGAEAGPGRDHPARPSGQTARLWSSAARDIARS